MGFSYGDTPQALNQSIPRYYEALQLFYEAFPKYNKSPLHLFGESFGARVMTLAAKFIIEQNLKLEKLSTVRENDLYSEQILPLASLALGNGWIDPRVQL